MEALNQETLSQTKDKHDFPYFLFTVYLGHIQDNKSTFTGICKTNNLVSACRNKELPFLRKESCLVGMHPCSLTLFIDLDRYPHTQTLYSGRQQRNVQNMKDWLHMGTSVLLYSITAGIKACRHDHNYSSEKGHDSNCGFISNRGISFQRTVIQRFGVL